MMKTDTTIVSAVAAAAPLPAPDPVGYAAAPAERRAAIEQAMAEIEMDDSNSILFFGTAAQDEVTTIADEMLEGVRNKNTGAAGAALSEMVATLRGLPLPDLNTAKQRGLFARVFRSARPIVKVLQQYEHVRSQVDAI